MQIQNSEAMLANKPSRRSALEEFELTASWFASLFSMEDPTRASLGQPRPYKRVRDGQDVAENVNQLTLTNVNQLTLTKSSGWPLANVIVYESLSPRIYPRQVKCSEVLELPNFAATAQTFLYLNDLHPALGPMSNVEKIRQLGGSDLSGKTTFSGRYRGL